MSVTARIATIGATPTLIEAGVAEGKIVLLRNATADIFLGGADVEAATGFPVTADDIVAITLIQGDVLYGVAAVEGDVNVLVTRDNT